MAGRFFIFAAALMFVSGNTIAAAKATDHKGWKVAAAKSKKTKSRKTARKNNSSTLSKRDIKIPPLPVRRDNAKATPDAEVTEFPKPDIWMADEIEAAKKACARILKSVKAITIPQPPIKKGACGDAAPVRLVSVGSNPPVSFSPPAMVNCQMVEALHKWTKKNLQPLAKKYLKSPIIKIEVMSDYSCRRAYGRKGGRLSEHAKANALDIRGFVTSQGRFARLLAHWGETKRDIAARKAEEAARKKRIAEAEERIRKVKAAAKAAAEENKTKSEDAENVKSAKVSTGSSDQPEKKTKPASRTKPNKLGGPKPGEPRFSPPKTQQARFLRAAHIGACKIFGTVLGPEANNAHRNHFHVDLAPRRRSNFCQ